MLARSVTLNVLGNAGSLAIGFAGSILLARWLGPTDRGLLALLQSVSLFGFTLGGIGLPMAVLYYASRPDRSAPRLLGTSLVYALALAAVLVPAAWFLRDPLADVFAQGRGGWIWILAAAYVPVLFLDSSTHNQILGKLLFGRYNGLSIAGKVASFALVVVLVYVLGYGVAGGMVALSASSIVMIAGCLPPLLRQGRPRFDSSLLRTMVGYGSRVQVGAIFSTLNYRLDVVILQFFRPLSEVGYYVVAQVVAELVIVLANSFQSSVIPLVAGSEGDSRDRTTILAIRHHGILAAAGCLANAVFGTLVILFAYGSGYRPAIVPMLILMPGIWFLGTGSVVTSDLRGRDRPGLASKVSGLALVLTVSLDLALIPPLGVEGAALASLVAYTAYGIVSLVALSRASGIPLRRLVVPERADLAAYPAAARRLLRRPHAPDATLAPDV